MYAAASRTQNQFVDQGVSVYEMLMYSDFMSRLEERYPEHDFEFIDGGIRVRQVGPYYLDCMKMLFNWRLCLTPVDFPMIYEVGYCYTGPDQFEECFGDAMDWPDDNPAWTPPRHYKNATTGQINPRKPDPRQIGLLPVEAVV